MGLKIHHLCNDQKILFLIMTYHYHMVSIIIIHGSIIWKTFQIFKFEKKPKSFIIMLYVCYFYLLDLIQLISFVVIIYYKRYQIKDVWKLVTLIHFSYTKTWKLRNINYYCCGTSYYDCAPCKTLCCSIFFILRRFCFYFILPMGCSYANRSQKQP
jgi:hypothetical protein